MNSLSIELYPQDHQECEHLISRLVLFSFVHLAAVKHVVVVVCCSSRDA